MDGVLGPMPFWAYVPRLVMFCGRVLGLVSNRIVHYD